MLKKILLVVLFFVLGIPLLGVLFLAIRRTQVTSVGMMRSGSTGQGSTGITRSGTVTVATPGMVAESVQMPMGNGNAMYFATDEKAIAPVPPTVDDGSFTATEERSVIRTAQLSLLATNTRELVKSITNAIQPLEGVITQSNVFESEYEPVSVQATLTIRVPAERLEEALAAIKPLAAKVTSESVNADDVTEQKLDLEAQLRNLRATETQLLAIMADADTVEETLQVQRELNQTRSQIERLEARQENLTGATTMATINVFISTQESSLPLVSPQQPSLREEIQLAFRQMVQVYRNLAITVVRLTIILSPILVIVVLGGFIWWRRQRR